MAVQMISFPQLHSSEAIGTENRVSEKHAVHAEYYSWVFLGGGVVKPLGPPLNNGQPLTAKSAAPNGAWPL